MLPRVRSRRHRSSAGVRPGQPWLQNLAAPAPEAPRRQASADNPFEGAFDEPAAPPERPAAPSRREPTLGPAAAPEPARGEPVSVLKSGVVDGMAYTLYTDGSIEAELAQGVVRFGSIEELRNHLEKSA